MNTEELKKLLINDYMFCCAACGNELPLRYAGSVSKSFIRCKRCADKVYECSACHREVAYCDIDKNEKMCLDCCFTGEWSDDEAHDDNNEDTYDN